VVSKSQLYLNQRLAWITSRHLQHSLPTNTPSPPQDMTAIHTPRVHRVFTDMEHPHRCWPRDWTRDQCITVAQLRTGHSALLAAYLHRIGRRDSATCPHCNGADETAEHLVLHCPAHDQVRRESWPNLHYERNPRRLWSFLERIGAVAHPPDREWDRERERIQEQQCL